MPADRDRPRTLAEALRTASDEALAGLLEARSDLARPAPADVGQLAARAGGRGSVALAVDRLDSAHIAVLEALAWLPEPVGGAQLERVVHATPATTQQVLTGLRALALVWGGDADLRLVRSVRDIIGPAPGGLGPPLGQLLLALPPTRLQGLVSDLELAASADPGTNAARVAEAYADPTWAQARIDAAHAAAGDDVGRLLDRLTDGPPTGRAGEVPADIRLAAAHSPLEHLLVRGLLVATDARTVTLPGEIGLLRRGGHITRGSVAGPPLLPAHPVDQDLVDRVGAGAAGESVRRVELLLEGWGTAPPAVLRSGGIGVREVRTLAATLNIDQDQAGFWVEVARAAGLVAVGTAAEHDDAWLPTRASDRWRRLPTEGRWQAVADAWLHSPRATALVGHQDESGRRAAPLAPDLERGAVASFRAAALTALAGLASGMAPDDDDDVVSAVAWTRPRRRELRDRTVRRTLLEAAWLGVTGSGSLTSYGRRLLAGADPAGTLGPLLPTPVDHVLLQADLTAVAPGPLEPVVATGIGLLADVESHGGATVYRFSAATVRRAFDAGWPAAQVHAFLAAHSRTPVPQPLTYLVDDAARQHGRIRVGGAGVYVRADDPAELDTLLVDPLVSALRLRRLAPTVAVSPAPPDVVLARLRDAHRAPLLEDADGHSAEVSAAGQRRRAPDRTTTRVISFGRADAVAVVAAVRAGERARDARPDDDPDGVPVPPRRLVEELRTAAEDGRAVWLAYLDETGTVSERVVDPVGIDGGRLTAYDHRSARTRSFALHRISRVGAAG